MELLETIPTMELTAEDIETATRQLEEYHRIYSPLFNRREQRYWSEKYLHGLLLNITRKSIEPMIWEMFGADSNAIRAMQQFIGKGSWSDEAILQRHWQEVDLTLGEADGVITIDGSDFPKQGNFSVGVKRQYCGQLGKKANCQAGVFAGYVSSQGYTLLDRRLYLPEEWIDADEYKKRRERCEVPEGLVFKTKQTLASEMVREIVTSEVLRCQWVVCDEAFGRDTAFLEEIASTGLWYLAEVPRNTRVWLEAPMTGIPKWSGRGAKPKKEKLLPGEPIAQTVAEVAFALPSKQWVTYQLPGSAGPIVGLSAALRVVNVRSDLPGEEVWLICRLNPQTGELKTYISNAPASLSLETLVKVSSMRWSIETCFQQGKQYLGMGDYEVRSWKGWHHHMTLCILAHHFLVRLQQQLKKKADGLTLPQIYLVLINVLPLKNRDLHKLLAVLRYRQARNRAAYLSHRRRRFSKLPRAS